MTPPSGAQWTPVRRPLRDAGADCLVADREAGTLADIGRIRAAILDERRADADPLRVSEKSRSARSRLVRDIVSMSVGSMLG